VGHARALEDNTSDADSNNGHILRYERALFQSQPFEDKHGTVQQMPVIRQNKQQLRSHSKSLL
jgi:hypothetical protein